MSISTVVTLGYSISGGLSAGTSTLPTLGYGIATPAVTLPNPLRFTTPEQTDRRFTVPEQTDRRFTVPEQTDRRFLSPDDDV